MLSFPSVEDAAASVSRALAAGHLPAALEILDRESLDMLGNRLPRGFSPDAGAALIVEQDGNDEASVETELMRTVDVLGGIDNWIARSSSERERLWSARRNFGVILMAMPTPFLCEDVAVPISRIPEMVRRIQALGEQTGLRIATVGHAGDGNLHPTFLFAEHQRPLVSAACAQLFRDAIDLGGTISAEHGLGVLKRDFAEAEHGSLAMDLMAQIKQVLDPDGLLNPHKIFPEHPADDEFLNNLPGWIPDLDHRPRRGEAVL
jgi:glycolate oxidase